MLEYAPVGTEGFYPSKNALRTFSNLGPLNVQKLAEDRIITVHAEPLTIKMDFM